MNAPPTELTTTADPFLPTHPNCNFELRKEKSESNVTIAHLIAMTELLLSTDKKSVAKRIDLSTNIYLSHSPLSELAAPLLCPPGETRTFSQNYHKIQNRPTATGAFLSCLLPSLVRLSSFLSSPRSSLLARTLSPENCLLPPRQHRSKTERRRGRGGGRGDRRRRERRHM